MSFTPLNLLLFLIPQDELGKPGAARKTLPFIPHPPTASEARLPLAPDKPHSGFESLADCKAHFWLSQAQAVGFFESRPCNKQYVPAAPQRKFRRGRD